MGNISETTNNLAYHYYRGKSMTPEEYSKPKEILWLCNSHHSRLHSLRRNNHTAEQALKVMKKEGTPPKKTSPKRFNIICSKCKYKYHTRYEPKRCPKCGSTTGYYKGRFVSTWWETSKREETEEAKTLRKQSAYLNKVLLQSNQ